MGFKLFSASTFETFGSFEPTKIVRALNPDPKNWKVIKKKESYNGGFIMVMINYPDATNYEGNKLMIMANAWFEECQTTGILDPHFFPEKGPIVRIQPTEDGWQLGLLILNNL